MESNSSQAINKSEKYYRIKNNTIETIIFFFSLWNNDKLTASTQNYMILRNFVEGLFKQCNYNGTPLYGTNSMPISS